MAKLLPGKKFPDWQGRNELIALQGINIEKLKLIFSIANSLKIDKSDLAYLLLQNATFVTG